MLSVIAALRTEIRRPKLSRNAHAESLMGVDPVFSLRSAGKCDDDYYYCARYYRPIIRPTEKISINVNSKVCVSENLFVSYRLSLSDVANSK